MAFTPIDEEEIIDEPVAEEAKPRFIPIEDDEFFGIGGEEDVPEPVAAPEAAEPIEAPKSRFTPISEEEFFGLPEPTEPIPVTGEEGFLRQAADVPLKIGESINTSLRALTDLFGADNAVSQNLTQNAEWYRSLLSAQALEDEQEIGRILKEAENEGILDQLGAGLEAFSVAPVDFVASGIGSLATFAATGVLGRAAAVAGAARAGLTGVKAAQFVKRGVQATQLATGAGMGAGIVKGEIYQSVKDEMLAQGKTEEEARRIAMEAQSYMGKNLDQILLGAGLGTIDAFTGAEKILGKVLTKGGLKPDASRIGNIIKNGITEAAPEFIQAAQEKFASNLALQREGVDVSLTQGVFSQGALEGLVGLGLGVGGGAIEPRIQTEPTKEEVSAAAAETQDVARRSMDVAPATASLVEGEAEQIIKAQAETPDERVARLQREAQEAAGDIELEEEVSVSGLPAQPVTPTPEAPPVAPVAPVEPVVPAEGAVEPAVVAAPTEPVAPTEPAVAEPTPVVTPRPAVDVEALSPNAKRANRILTNAGVDPETAAFVSKQYQDEIADLGGEELRAFVLDKFEENGGVIPAQMRYSEDQEYYEMAFGIGPEEAATLVENAKAQNAQMAQAELDQNKQWRRKDEQIKQTEQGVAVAQPEVQAVPVPAGEVPPSPAIEGRRVPLAAPEAPVTPTPTEVAPTRSLADLEVRPPTDNVQQVAAANDLTVGRADVNIPAQELESTVNLADPKERERVDRLKEQISSEGGFISRVIVDGQNNVVEGQHRVQAMKELGYDQIPAVQLKSAEDFIPDSNALDKVMQDAGLTASDNRTQMRQLIAEIISDEKGDVAQLREYEAPAGFETAWNAATEEVIRQNDAPEVAPPPTAELPALAPLRRVAKAEQTEDDVSGLVGQGLVELYKGQPVITQAGLETLPEAERPRLTPEARKIQIDTRTSEAAAEAISKNLRIGVDQVPVDVKMPEGWTLEGDIYIPPTLEAAPEARESRREPVTPQQDRDYLDAVERGDLDAASRVVEDAAKRAGYNIGPVFHGHRGERFTEFRRELLGKTTGARTASLGFFFSKTPYVAQQFEGFGEKQRPPTKNFISIKNPIIFQSEFVTKNGEIVRDRYGRPLIKKDAFDKFWEMVSQMLEKEKKDISRDDIIKLRSSWEKLGYDSIRFEGTMMDSGASPDNQFVVFNPEQIKSAEPVTRDDAGNIIPPSQRFQPTEADIRYARGQAGVGMTTDAVRARLEALGFGVEGMIRVVEDPQAAFEGRTIIQDGKAVRIELNASALRDNAAIDRVLNHEFAESANADGALNKLVERLTTKEKKEINDAITRLGYEERVRTTEEAARAIETLAAAWKGRGFFERAVARIQAWGSKLGFKLTRKAAEYIAARNLSDVNAGFKAAYNRFINVRGEAREGRAFVTPEENARFMELAKDPEANREELQRMVDEAAKRSGHTIKGYHGTRSLDLRGNKFDTEDAPYRGGLLAFFANDRIFAEDYAFGPLGTETGRVYETYLKIQEPLDYRKTEVIKNIVYEFYNETGGIRDSDDINRLELGDGRDIDDPNIHTVYPQELFENALLEGRFDAFEATEFGEWLQGQGFDGVIMLENGSLTYGVFRTEQIKLSDPITYDDQGNVIPLEQRFQSTSEDIRYSRTEIRESRREPEPRFTEESPEAKTLSTMRATMEKVDVASEAKGGKPETQKISEIAANWMEQGGDTRALQDAIVENTNLSPANAAKVAKVIAKQYGLQQQIAETGAVIAEIAPEAEGSPRKSSVTKLIEATTGVRKPVVKLQVSESAALKKQIQLKAREARETRKARKEAAEDLAKSITDYVKANPIRGPINSRQAMSITKRALKLDVNNEAAVDRFEMYVERVIENANYDRDLADARSLIKRAKAFAKAKDTQGNVKTTLDAIANISPTLLDNPFEFNLVVQRYLLGLAPVTAKQYAVMPDADVRRYLESLETQIKSNQEILDRAKAQRILDKQSAYATEKGIPLDEAISILNSEETLQERTIEKLEDLTRLLSTMAQESQKDVKAYDETGATPKQKELISFMRKVSLDSLTNEEKKRYIRFSNNLLANGATFGMEQFQSIALGQEAAIKALKDKRLSNKLAAWISPIGGDKAIDTARRIALRTQSEADTFKNIFGREAVGAIRKLLGLNRLDSAQTDSNKAKEQIANEVGEYYASLRKKYGDDATGFEAKGYAGVAGYLIQTDGIKTEAESIPYRRRLLEQNIAELRKSDKQADLTEADFKERALSQLTGTSNAEILSQLQALNPASYEQLMWWKDTMLPKWRDFLKEHDENFRNQANNYNNPDHLTITYKFPEGQLLPNEIEKVYQQDHIGMRIKQAANSIKRKDHPNLPVAPQTGTIANIDINFGYNQYNALVDQVDKAYVAPAWEQVVAFTKAPEFEQIMGGRANANFVKKLLVDIQTSRTRQSMTDDEAQMVAGGVRLARKISTQAVLGGFTQPLRQVPDQLSKLFFTTGRFDLITKNLLNIAQAAPLMNKFPIGRRGDAQAGTQYASQFSELARRVEASVTDRKWAKYRELMNRVGEFWMAPLRGSDVWAAKVSWMTYYEAYLNKQDIKMESWEREAELVDTDDVRKEAAAYAEYAVDFYGGASDPTKMASLSKQTNNGWKEFAKLMFLPLNSFALQQKNSLISDLRDAYLRTGDRKAAIAGIAGTLAGMASFHAMRIYIIGGLIYPAGKALLMGIFGIDMDEPDEEEKQKKLEDNWRKFKSSMYGNIIAGGAGQFVEQSAIDAVNKATYLIQANVNPDELLNDKGEVMSFRQYEKDLSPLYRFRSFGTSEYSFGLADVLTEQAQRSLMETQQIMTAEEMERYTGNEQAYAMFSTMVEWLYFFRLMDTDVTRIARDLKRQMDKQVEEREAEIRAIRNR